MELSCTSYFFEAFSKASVWNCRARVAFPSYLSSFCVELSRKSCLVKVFFKLLHGTVMQTLPYEVFLESLHATVVQKLPLNLFLKLSHGTVMQELPSKLFLTLLFGTVAQKLPCKAIPQGKTLTGVSQVTAMCF